MPFEIMKEKSTKARLLKWALPYAKMTDSFFEIVTIGQYNPKLEDDAQFFLDDERKINGSDEG